MSSTMQHWPQLRRMTAANDLLRFARRIFSFGVRRLVVPVNPIVEFSPRLDAGGPEKSRSRALSHEELIRLFESIRETESVGGDNLLAVKLLLALGLASAGDSHQDA